MSASLKSLFDWRDDGRNLYIKGELFAQIAVHEDHRAIYSVWSDLPGWEDPEDIKGVRKARRVAEQAVEEWFNNFIYSE